jgi:hypothetical protein
MSPHGISQSSNLERIVRGNHNFKACIERSGGQRQQIAPDAAVLCRRRLNTRTEQRKQNDEFDFHDWSIFREYRYVGQMSPDNKERRSGTAAPPHDVGYVRGLLA